MSALLKLHHEIVSRRNLAVLQEVMQSRRASLLQKQEAELTLLRTQLYEAYEDKNEIEIHEGFLVERNSYLESSMVEAEAAVDRLAAHAREMVHNYWAIINDCVEVLTDTKENARGQKRKPPATEQLKKLRMIVLEHCSKRSRIVENAVAGTLSRAGSSTDYGVVQRVGTETLVL